MSKDENALFLKDPAGDYPTIVRGEGIYLYDEEGRRWIDGAAGASNVTLGHGRRDIARVLGDQAASLAYAFSVHFESRPAREYAARLTALAPGDLEQGLLRLRRLRGDRVGHEDRPPVPPAEREREASRS